MLIPGEWSLDHDGVERPVLRAEALTAAGTWLPVTFLVDTAADRTVFHAGFFDLLGFEPLEDSDQLAGVGGLTRSVKVPTRLRLTRSDGVPVPINGPFGVFVDPAAADCSLLGRDVLNHFGLIVDYESKVVCLLHGRHRYVIQET
jgi:hypothetical protein